MSDPAKSKAQRLSHALVDTGQPIRFSYNDVRYDAFMGDTLSSALFANQQLSAGISPCDHRPRGVFSTSWEDPSFYVSMGEEAALHNPSQIELRDGMAFYSQQKDKSRWSDKFAAFKGKGEPHSPVFDQAFLRSKYLWPKLIEPMMRKAQTNAVAPPSSFVQSERGFLFCDVLIIGSGIAGLMAARESLNAGKDVIVVEQDFEFGGALIKSEGNIQGLGYREWRNASLKECEGHQNLRMLKRAFALGIYQGGICAVKERKLSGDGHHIPSNLWAIEAKEIILATGAREKPAIFSGNDLPGILQCTALRELIHRFGITPPENLVIYSNNNAGLRLVEDLRAHSITPKAIIIPDASILDAKRADSDIEIIEGDIKSAKGENKLQELAIATKEGERKIPCEALAVSAGFQPNLELAIQLGAKAQFDESLRCLLPSFAHDHNIQLIGALAGKFSDQDILEDIEKKLSKASKPPAKHKTSTPKPSSESASFKITAMPAATISDRAFLSLSKDISTADLRRNYRKGVMNLNHLLTALGLNDIADQSQCAVLDATEILQTLTGENDPNPSPNFAIRQSISSPPNQASAIATLAANAGLQHEIPTRHSPAHQLSTKNGAQFVDRGAWRIPSHFHQTHESVWRQSADREALWIHNHVGVADRSACGKISLTGEGASAILDQVLLDHKSRAEKMADQDDYYLDEEGYVLDQCACASIEPNHYLLSASPERTKKVLSVLKAAIEANPKAQSTSLTDITDQYAQFLLIGPKAREIILALTNETIDLNSAPYFRPIHIGGISGFLKLSPQSQPDQFEIYCPRSYGESLFQELLNRARECQGGAVGLEALNVIRLENGHIGVREFVHQVTPRQLGLAPKSQKLSDEEELVAIKPIGAVQRLLAGSLMIGEGKEAQLAHCEGHVSSVCYSPMLNKMLGLAFLKNGHSRLGERIRAVDLVRDFDTLCEIVDRNALRSSG